MKRLPRLLAPTLIFLLFVFFSKLPQSLRAATLRFDQFGQPNLIDDKGLILGLIADKGSDDQKSDGERSGSSGGSSRGSSSDSSDNSSSQLNANPSINTQPVSQPTTLIQPGTETEKRENKTETRISRERVEMKTKEMEKTEMGRSKNEMEMKGGRGKLKLETETAAGIFKLEIEDGKIKVNRETKSRPVRSEDENEVENEDEATPSAGVEKVEIEEGVNLKTTKISALAGQMKIENQGAAALTKLPLSIDSRTNQLIITTPNKKTIVTTLPSQAIANLISRGIIDSAQNLLDLPSPEATDSARAEIKAPKTELVERNGEVVYRVVGVKTRKFLNLIPTTFNLEAEVNAQTGALVNLQEPTVLRLFGFLFGQ